MRGFKSPGEMASERPVASLALAEQIVVWGLRRYRAAGEGLASLAPMFERIFGADASDALERFADLVRALEDLPRPAAAAFLAQRLSPVERDLLDLMALLHRRRSTEAAGLAATLATGGTVAKLMAAADGFAQALASAGLPIAADPAATAQGFASPSVALPAALLVSDLVGAELLLLHAMRLWVVSIRLQRCARERIARHFIERGVPDAAPSLHAILEQTSIAATRQVDVRCPACRLLSPDEARLLHAVACSQRSDRRGAGDALADWLPTGAVRLALEPVAGLARALARAEVELPARRWDFDRLDRLAAAAAAVEPEDCTLH